MKKMIWVAWTVKTVLFCPLSYANYTIELNNVDACHSIAGTWVGKGKATNWIIGTCKYHGEGMLGNIDNAGRFTITASAHKDYGNALCPQRVKQVLNAVCINGVMSVKTDYGSLRGVLNEMTGSANGTLSLSPGMDAKVSLQFSR